METDSRKDLVSVQLGPQQQGREPYLERGSCPYWTFQPMFVLMSQIGMGQSPSQAPEAENGFAVPFTETKETVPFRPAMLVEFEGPVSQLTADQCVKELITLIRLIMIRLD
jgi:hypothetical protein